MKNVLIVIIVFLLISCDIDASKEARYNYNLDATYAARLGFDLVTSSEFDDIKTIKDIDNFLWYSFKYMDESVDTWNSPQTTLRTHFGDCEDFVILYLNILYVKFNIKASMALVNSIDRAIDNGGYVNHAVILFDDGTLFEPRQGIFVEHPVSYSYSFSDIFK